MKVLMVEDDPMVAKFNRMYVERVPGFDVAGHAENLTKAKEMLQAEAIDIVLLDVYLSKENGLDLLEELRKERIPVDVIAITSANDTSSLQRAKRLGCTDYLIKPFHFERFREALLNVKEWQKASGAKKEWGQDDVDQLFLANKGTREEHELPKGLTTETFRNVGEEILKYADSTFTTQGLAESTGISRVSVRKYLAFLEGEGVLKITMNYAGSGRPLQQYTMPPEQVEILKDWMEK
ncbi:hypothetical protein CHL76_00780 [Marinococcus halophilus]|uniref:Transcriptional regulatory protein n=1 Tax=Marinococcus halophilus TaxID=1371 RepID=A0A510Y2R3_MARHA|nr:response regulator [Marinococcus halophilus]OZT81663.1 hypothetical protein CHL76_00780 [Marinococcus halophilus]GEK57612.1 transcriptional regulatory protein [Marinococcus halophilus]